MTKKKEADKKYNRIVELSNNAKAIHNKKMKNEHHN